MKIIAILDVDPDTVLETRLINALSLTTEEWNAKDIDEQAKLIAASGESVSGAVEAELGWAEESGITVNRIVMPDELSNDEFCAGTTIKAYLTD